MSCASAVLPRRVPVFRFDTEHHAYFLDDEEIPHITGLLNRSGWIDDTWFTEESCERGQIVHALTAAYDLGGLQTTPEVSAAYRPYLLAHITAMNILRPQWSHIEIPMVHRGWRFGGRPDRLGTIDRLQSGLELKTGAKTRAIAIQLALQAILAAAEGGMPAQHRQRLALYLRPTGTFRLIEYNDRRDYDEAYRLLRTYCTPM